MVKVSIDLFKVHLLRASQETLADGNRASKETPAVVNRQERKASGEENNLGLWCSWQPCGRAAQ